jgi:hypothetical protein
LYISSVPIFAFKFLTTIFISLFGISSWFNYLNNIWRRMQSMKLWITHFSPFLCYFFRLKPKYSPQHPFSGILCTYSSSTMRDIKFHAHSKQAELCSFVPFGNWILSGVFRSKFILVNPNFYRVYGLCYSGRGRGWQQACLFCSGITPPT